MGWWAHGILVVEVIDPLVRIGDCLLMSEPGFRDYGIAGRLEGMEGMAWMVHKFGNKKAFSFC